MNEQLENFIHGYVDTLLWTGWFTEGSEIESEDLRPYVHLLNEESLLVIQQDCEDFWNSNQGLLSGLDPYSCGSDFALTRNRHGTGFWDRGLGKVGEELTKMAHPYGESNAYFLSESYEVVVEN